VVGWNIQLSIPDEPYGPLKLATLHLRGMLLTASAYHESTGNETILVLTDASQGMVRNRSDADNASQVKRKELGSSFDSNQGTLDYYSRRSAWRPRYPDSRFRPFWYCEEETPIEPAAAPSDRERNDECDNKHKDKRNDKRSDEHDDTYNHERDCERNDDHTKLEELTIYAYFDEPRSQPTQTREITVLPIYYSEGEQDYHEIRPRFVRGLLLRAMCVSRKCNCTSKRRLDKKESYFVPAGLCIGHLPVFQRIGSFRSFVDMPQAMLEVFARTIKQDIILE